MKIFPYEKLDVKVSSSSEKIVSLFLKSPVVRLVSRENNKIVFYIKKPYRKSFAPKITLLITEQENKSLLKFEFKVATIIKVFSLLWLGLVFTFSYLLFSNSSKIETIAIPAFATLFLFLTIYLGFYFGYDKVLAELRKITQQAEKG